MTIVIPRGFPVYAFMTEWMFVAFWFLYIIGYVLTYLGWRKGWLTLSYRS